MPGLAFDSIYEIYVRDDGISIQSSFMHNHMRLHFELDIGIIRITKIKKKISSSLNSFYNTHLMEIRFFRSIKFGNA